MKEQGQLNKIQIEQNIIKYKYKNDYKQLKDKRCLLTLEVKLAA